MQPSGVRALWLSQARPGSNHVSLKHKPAAALQAAMVSWAEIMVRRRSDAVGREVQLQAASQQLQALLFPVVSEHKNLSVL